jgi:hypothetical protein
MNELSVVEYCRALISHLVLAWQCRESRPSKRRRSVNAASDTAAFNSIAGRRTYIDMERRVAELLSGHHHLAAVSLLGVVLVSTATSIAT